MGNSLDLKTNEFRVGSVGILLGLALSVASLLGQGASIDAGAPPTIVINEFVAINDSGLRDEDGEHGD